MSDRNGALYDNMAFDNETTGLLTRVEKEHLYSSISVKEEESWQVPLSDFLSKKQGTRVKDFKSRRLRSYYKAQDEQIACYEEASGISSDDVMDFEAEARQTKRAMRYSQVTFAINFLLMSAKLVASILSGSMSIISSLIDSVVDLLSGIIMWWAARAIRKKDRYTYPQGRTKLEPVSIIILSVVMSLASIEFIRESVTKIIDLIDDPTSLPTVQIPTFVIAGSTVVIKFILWLVCRRVNSNLVQALALDHRNDVMSNTVAIICGYLGSKEFQDSFNLYGFIYVDPGGAILISLYIIVNWCLMGREQIKLLTGHTADRQFLSKVTWLALNHDRNIRQIDTVRAFHFGNNFLVDVDIVLPKNMEVETAHDIAETLQQKLESMAEVERAYVHVDHETTHNPLSEHKVM